MAESYFGGVRPWEMERFTLQEYVGLHYYRQAIESQD